MVGFAERRKKENKSTQTGERRVWLGIIFKFPFQYYSHVIPGQDSLNFPLSCTKL